MKISAVFKRISIKRKSLNFIAFTSLKSVSKSEFKLNTYNEICSDNYLINLTKCTFKISLFTRSKHFFSFYLQFNYLMLISYQLKVTYEDTYQKK